MADSYGSHNEPQYDENAPIHDAVEKTELGAYAALVGNHKVGTDAARLALSGNDLWDGLHYTSTDLSPAADWRYDVPGGWKALPEYGSYSTSGIFTPGTGWNYSAGGNQSFELIGDWLVWCYVHITRVGGTITVPADGNLVNLNIGHVTGPWIARNTTPLGAGQSGRNLSVNALTDGTFSLVSVSQGNDIVNGDAISFGGIYPRTRGY